MNTVLLRSSDSIDKLRRPQDALQSSGEDPFAEGPEFHLAARSDVESDFACCSLWTRETPELEDELVACIGHFYANSDQYAAVLLSEALDILRKEGATFAIGPMNGNTWRKYRFVTDSNGERPFFMEPQNPETWPSQWRKAGFADLAGYHSSLISDLQTVDPRIARAEQRLGQNGIHIRGINMSKFEGELGKIFQVSSMSFTSNYLYTPISEDAFRAMYLPIKDYVDPKFVQLAELNGKAIGYIFSIPDVNQLKDIGECDTLIVKTVAILPDYQFAGLGTVLVDRMRQAARESGYRRIVHALMRDQNISANIGKYSEEILRRYTLFGKSLHE